MIIKHFKKIGEGLKSTKDKLGELATKIASTVNANVTGVDSIIKSAGEVITKLVASVEKLAGVTKGGSTNIGDVETSRVPVVAGSDLNVVIEGIKDIMKTATNSGVTIDTGDAGSAVDEGNANAGASIVGKDQSNKADSGAAAKLADEVAKADPWAMINKITNAKSPSGSLVAKNDAVALATKLPGGASQNGALTNADLAAAVALKAMTKDSKFSANSGEEGTIKSVAVNSVNKVLGILDEIIRRTVNHELGKVKEAVKGIQYSENAENNATEASNSAK